MVRDFIYYLLLFHLTEQMKFFVVLNYRHRMAQQASRSSVELYTNLYFKGKNIQEEGFVIRVLKNGFVVLIPR